jgi:hypothetical protein
MMLPKVKELLQAKAIERATMLIISIFITLFILKFLWNRYLVKHITILKPITSFKDALMLSIALGLIKSC